MANGVITGSTSNTHIKARIVWSSVTDVVNNRSMVTCSLQFKKTSTYENRTTGSGRWKITCNGEDHANSKSITLWTDNGWVTAVPDYTFTVPHETDGTKRCLISASVVTTIGSLRSMDCSETVELDPIVQGDIPVLRNSSPVLLNNNPTLTFDITGTRGYYRRLELHISNQLVTSLAFERESTVSIPVPDVLSQSLLPTSIDGEMTATLFTYDEVDSTLLGTQSITFPVTVGGYRPMLDDCVIEAEQLDEDIALLDLNTFFYGKTKVRLSDNGFAYTARGAGIAEYRLIVNGVTYSSSALPITQPQALTESPDGFRVLVQFTDTRGYTSDPLFIRGLTAMNYTRPEISGIECYRVNGNGVRDPQGTRIFAKASVSVCAAPGITLRTFYTWVNRDYAHQTTMTEQGVIFEGPFSIDSTHTVHIYATDSAYYSREETFVISTDVVTFNANEGGLGFAFGRYSQRDYLLDLGKDEQDAWDIRAKGAHFKSVEADDGIIARTASVADVANDLADDYVVPISKGGTGAQFANVALAALGGAKQNHSHAYSDLPSGIYDYRNEQEVGVWTDGDTLYRRVWTGTNPANGTTLFTGMTGAMLVRYQVIWVSSGNATFTGSMYGSSNNWLRWWIDTGSTWTLGRQNGSNQNTIGRVVVIVEYTR